MSRFRLAREAKADIRAIRAYIAQDKPVAALRFLDDLCAKLRLAATQPLMGESSGRPRAGLANLLSGQLRCWIPSSK
jgi:plasmid stabilization system protein ParE